MSVRSNLLLGASLGALLLAPAVASAQAVNPNAQEWALINLQPTDVASANGGAGVIVGLFDGLTDCRHPDLTGRCTNTLISGGRYRFYDNHGTHTAGIIEGKQF